MIRCEVEHNVLEFKRPAKTSRGQYTEHDSWLLKVTDEQGRQGAGEAAPLPDLSCDASLRYDDNIRAFARDLERNNGCIDYEKYQGCSSMFFAAESALRQLKGEKVSLSKPIQINGLIWMGDLETMKERVDEKLSAGFRCIKIKVGGLDFEKEIELIRYLRENPKYPERGKSVELRLDANCAFKPEEAMVKLEKLAKFDVHSIEQPIAVGLWDEMRYLCKNSPIGIALDEELIGIHTQEDMIRMMEAINPQSLVIKPTLHGGFKGAEEWIKLCKQMGIGWWVTSALEGNIGLDAIADWLQGQEFEGRAHGLGTGLLYVKNYDSGYGLKGDEMVHIRS
ncbi:MAG: o-succinylbenzoate synthase [Bacteroidales bacterium]|nr:o-succinylbenzoate synthase [Bacteroidales bacterium]